MVYCSEIFDCINGDCSICIENPENDIKDLQKAGRSYRPIRMTNLLKRFL